MMDKTKLILIILAILIILGVVAVQGFKAFTSMKIISCKEEYQQGRSDLMKELLNITVTCQNAAIELGGEKVNLVDLSCARKSMCELTPEQFVQVCTN